MTDFRTIASQRPKNLDEALVCLRKALDYYHERNDYRAIFLRAYYIVTVDVHAAVNQLGDYQEQIFFDPRWIDVLVGKFSSLYFESLTTFERDPDAERAWKLAHKTAIGRTSTVAQDLILGLNAHINYDLAYGVYLNLKEHNDQSNQLLLPRRKFDHDQINYILVRCMPKISETLTRDYGGGIVLISRIMRNLDEMLTESGLKYYRERVWWNAISYLATGDKREIDLVHDRLNWESAKVANALSDDTIWNRTIRTVGTALRKKRFGKIELEGTGGARTAKPTSRAVLSPF